MQGLVVKKVSNFFEIAIDNEKILCQASKTIQHDNKNIYVGDYVEFDYAEKYITKVKSRKNLLMRPILANVDLAGIVMSLTEPKFSSSLLDRFLILIQNAKIKPIIIITKADLLSKDNFDMLKPEVDYYEQIGFKVIYKNNLKTELLPLLENKITILAGQTGVGKSTIINELNGNDHIKTQAISQKLSRGKHTTTYSELHPFANGYLADTPGFSSLNFNNLKIEDIKNYYPEFANLNCKFRNCLHVGEPGCQFKSSMMSKTRYAYYQKFLEEVKNENRPINFSK